MDGNEWAESTEHGVAENVAVNVTVSATFEHDPLCLEHLDPEDREYIITNLCPEQ